MEAGCSVVEVSKVLSISRYQSTNYEKSNCNWVMVTIYLNQAVRPWQRKTKIVLSFEHTSARTKSILIDEATANEKGLSRQTVVRCLNNAGWKVHWPAMRPHLSEVNRFNRLKWAQNHIPGHWLIGQVFFSKMRPYLRLTQQIEDCIAIGVLMKDMISTRFKKWGTKVTEESWFMVVCWEAEKLRLLE